MWAFAIVDRPNRAVMLHWWEAIALHVVLLFLLYVAFMFLKWAVSSSLALCVSFDILPTWASGVYCYTGPTGDVATAICGDAT